MAAIVEQEALRVRKMSDAAAFAHIVETYPPGDPKSWAMALHLVRRRPWRKAFHRPLADLYLRGIDHNGFAFAAEAFATFMRVDMLSRIFWKETEDRPDKRVFAALALASTVRKNQPARDDALTRWRPFLPQAGVPPTATRSIKVNS